jgi:hypothetical protein
MQKLDEKEAFDSEKSKRFCSKYVSYFNYLARIVILVEFEVFTAVVM